MGLEDVDTLSERVHGFLRVEAQLSVRGGNGLAKRLLDRGQALAHCRILRTDMRAKFAIGRRTHRRCRCRRELGEARFHQAHHIITVGRKLGADALIPALVAIKPNRVICDGRLDFLHPFFVEFGLRREVLIRMRQLGIRHVTSWLARRFSLATLACHALRRISHSVRSWIGLHSGRHSRRQR